tara:strand:- start:307 stop:429 length:123 start_codon:yes stop_codon:yes gene_type:complete
VNEDARNWKFAILRDRCGELLHTQEGMGDLLIIEYGEKRK